jgi:hypothetical protein
MGREENQSLISEKNLDESFAKSEQSLERSTCSEINYKTELCRTWVEKNYCPYKEKCRFAHGKKDLHEKSVSSKHYKQKECNSFYKKGFCPYGPRCHFKHEERRLEDISRPYYQIMLLSPKNLGKILSRNLNCSGDTSEMKEILNTENNSQAEIHDYAIGFHSNSNSMCHFNTIFPDGDYYHREINHTKNLPVFKKIKDIQAPSPLVSTNSFSHNNKQTRKFVLNKNILSSFM